MSISSDSQGEGTGQQLSPVKAYCSGGLQELGLPFWLHTGNCKDMLVGSVTGVLSGRNLMGRLGSRLLFSFHSFAYPCTISRVDHGDLGIFKG